MARKAAAVGADLFGNDERLSVLPAGATLLPGYALEGESALLSALSQVIASAPLRQMVTPGGHTMSVAMTNCGALGWVTDRTGYRYDRLDPESGVPWPAMPAEFLELAVRAAQDAGYAGFVPDACLINRYEPGAKMSLHQDKNEHDFAYPIVSLSLGLQAVFQFGGLQRTDPVQKLTLTHGDVMVWGGPARLAYHGILPLKDGVHPVMGRMRMNLTFRKAG
jgi:alkylated DNA repair protein (DNA oxidative demethylase)